MAKRKPKAMEAEGAQEGLDTWLLQRSVDRMKRDPEYRKKIETRAKRAEEKDLIRKVKNKGHMTHGSKYQKIKPGMVDKLREGPLYK